MKNYYLVSYRKVNGFIRNFMVHCTNTNIDRLKYLYESDRYNDRKMQGYIFEIVETCVCLPMMVLSVVE